MKATMAAAALTVAVLAISSLALGLAAKAAGPDGANWATAASGIAYRWKRPISIEPTTARYLRITQTGTAPQWWSIDDVTAYSSY